MSSGEDKDQRTQHAFLIAWGWFAEHIGLPDRFEHIPLKQKRYQHTPQTKVLEFLVSILGGAQYLQDISQAAHPLDKDQAVADAWGQPGWADYSGVSRTLSGLSWEEAQQIAQVLEEIGQGYVKAELQMLQSTGQRIQYDGDLTGLPVSNTSQTIEAGIKETKQVFFLHHIKVRSEPAIFLQECFVLFAANFIRCATHWLIQQAVPAKNAIDVRKLGTKRQVKVAAHVSAQVIQNAEGKF